MCVVYVMASAIVFGPVSAASTSPDAEAYARAERVLDYNLRGKVLNATVSPQWLADGRFWYRRQEKDGASYVLIDPAKASRGALFDGKRLARALGDARGKVAIDVESVTSDADGVLRIRVRDADGRARDCRLPTYACRVVIALARDPKALASPDGTRAIVVRDDNLWLREAGVDGERALTRDGEPSHGYGVLPDFSLRGIPWRAGRMVVPPIAAHWSPDGARVFGVRYDERKVEQYPYLATAPEGSFRPIVHTVRLGLLGDAEQVRDSWYVIDVASATTRTIARRLEHADRSRPARLVGRCAQGVCRDRAL